MVAQDDSGKVQKGAQMSGLDLEPYRGIKDPQSEMDGGREEGLPLKD